MAHKQVPRIILRGDKEAANLMSREGMRQLDILKNLMSFQKLKQDVRRVRFVDRSEIICRSIFGIDDVQIYVPEKRVAREKEICSIQLLTCTVIPKPFPLISEITAEGFCLEANKDCDINLTKEGRKLKDEEVGYVQNLSQCKYCYIENEDEDDEIVRKASLFHYDYFWPLGGFSRVLRIVDHSGTADFELRIQIFIPPGGVVDLVGALSKDLTRLYISLYSASGYIPLKERSIQYFVYNLVETEEGNKWEFSNGGFTPVGYTYIDNVVTRDGKCGCWQLDVEESDKETFVYADTLQEDSCCPAGHNASGEGGKSFKQGTVVNVKFVTFSLESGSFIPSSKMEGYHMSPYLKDYAVCLAHEIAVYEFGGSPLSLTEADCVCRTHSCPHCVIWGNTIRINSLSYNKIYEAFNGGTVTLYHLYNGLETYAPLWTRFFTDYYQLLEDSYSMERDECPCPETGCARWKAFGSGHNYRGSGFSDLGSGYTTYIYRNVNTNECDITWSGNCGYDGSCQGYNLLPLCTKTSPSWICKTFGVGCHETYDDPGFANVKEKRLLSPLTMVLQDGESIGNTFISYDEETDSLIRGVKYKALDGKWYWKIKAKIPECDEKFITNEIETLLSSEHFDRLEAIIFTESPVMRHKYTVRREIQRLT